MTFQTTVELGGRTATGLPIPDAVVEALGQGSRPAVLVTVGGYSYRTTVARMGARFLAPLGAEHRTAYSHRKEWVRWVSEAKRPATRAIRVAATVEAMLAGRRTR